MEWIRHAKGRKSRTKSGKKSKKSHPAHDNLLRVILFFHDRSFEPIMRSCELCSYAVPDNNLTSALTVAHGSQSSTPEPGDVRVYTREAKRAAVSGKGIISHLLHHGVDNTGNIRVWVRE